jgi:hypothetical protein
MQLRTLSEIRAKREARVGIGVFTHQECWDMAPSEIIIHASYHPNGTIKAIGECPSNLTSQQWFNLLSTKIPHAGQPLAGGRHIFRVSAKDLEALKAEA